MSQSREKKRRYNQKLEFNLRFESWLREEPPKSLFWRWKKWKSRRPVLFAEDRS